MLNEIDAHAIVLFALTDSAKSIVFVGIVFILDLKMQAGLGYAPGVGCERCYASEVA